MVWSSLSPSSRICDSVVTPFIVLYLSFLDMFPPSFVLLSPIITWNKWGNDTHSDTSCCWLTSSHCFVNDSYLITCLLSTTIETQSVRITNTTVPRKAVIGQGVWLNCSYDLEKDSLYSIKWYKDEDEIYRFLPSNKPRVDFFEFDGASIDVSVTSCHLNVCLFVCTWLDLIGTLKGEHVCAICLILFSFLWVNIFSCFTLPVKWWRERWVVEMQLIERINWSEK